MISTSSNWYNLSINLDTFKSSNETIRGTQTMAGFLFNYTKYKYTDRPILDPHLCWQLQTNPLNISVSRHNKNERLTTLSAVTEDMSSMFTRSLWNKDMDKSLSTDWKIQIQIFPHIMAKIWVRWSIKLYIYFTLWIYFFTQIWYQVYFLLQCTHSK